MPTSDRKPLFRLDIPKRSATGEACILVYQTTDGFSFVATVRNAGDAELLLTKAELAQLQQGLAAIIA